MEIEKAGTDYQKSTVYTSDTISDLKLGDEMLIEEKEEEMLLSVNESLLKYKLFTE